MYTHRQLDYICTHTHTHKQERMHVCVCVCVCVCVYSVALNSNSNKYILFQLWALEGQTEITNIVKLHI
jgi:hypothetical protein